MEPRLPFRGCAPRQVRSRGGPCRRQCCPHGRRAWGIIGHIRTPFARSNIYPPSRAPPTRLPPASSGEAQRSWIMSLASTSRRHTVCRVLERFPECCTNRRDRCQFNWMSRNDGVGPLRASVVDSTELFSRLYGITSLQVCSFLLQQRLNIVNGRRHSYIIRFTSTTAYI